MSRAPNVAIGSDSEASGSEIRARPAKIGGLEGVELRRFSLLSKTSGLMMATRDGLVVARDDLPALAAQIALAIEAEGSGDAGI